MPSHALMVIARPQNFLQWVGPNARRTLEGERAQLTQRDVERQTQHERLRELSTACELVASNLNNLTYEQKRLALQTFDVQVKVYKENHEPRYEVVPGPSFVKWIVSSTELNQPISAVIDSRTARGTACSWCRSVGRRGRFR
jgi:hypothetical protein